MKDARTHLAHKAEHAVDLETGAIVGVTIQDADEGDTTTSRETLIEAAEQIEAVCLDGESLQEVVGDKGYHSNQSLVDLAIVGRIRCARGLRLLRLRGERLERPFAHLYETGGCAGCICAGTRTFERSVRRVSPIERHAIVESAVVHIGT